MNSIRAICERTDIGLFAEPLNTVSSFAFVLASLGLYKLYKDAYGKNNSKHFTLDIRVLILMAFATGIGSIALHSNPNNITETIDITNVTTFIVFFFFSATTRMMGCSVKTATLLFIAFLFLIGVMFISLVSQMNGVASYIATMAILAMMAFFMYGKGHSSAKNFLNAAFIGTTAMIFRVLDSKLCGVFAIGTHFMWHVLNALLMYIVVKEIILTSVKNNQIAYTQDNNKRAFIRKFPVRYELSKQGRIKSIKAPCKITVHR